MNANKLAYLLYLLPILFALQNLNNSCTNYFSYFNIFFSQECYYSPDVDDSALDIIHRHVGLIEIHQVQTEDGYILGLFRIPKENPKGVILLQHPIHFDATIWVSQYNESIAFLFWKAGYDVWMGNSRGTKYSKKHVIWTPSDAAFWNYSFHEMGYYDLSATIGYVKRVTQRSKVIYLGYSMSGASGLIYASTRPEEAANSLETMMIIAPVTHISTGSSIAKYIVPAFFSLARLFHLDLHSSLLGNDTWYVIIAKTILMMFPCKKCIVYGNALITGWTPNEFDPNFVNVFVTKFDTEIPLKVWHHFYQIFASGGVFHFYDYGAEGNLNMYGVQKAPLYPLETIKVPVFVVYGQNDSFTTPTDIDKMYSMLSKESKIHGKLSVEGFGHSDFAFGRHRDERVYHKILQRLEDI